VDVTTPTYTIRAVDRVVDILDALRQSPRGLSLGALAAAAGLPKSSAFRYLATLEARGYVIRDDAGDTYRLGQALGQLQPRELARLSMVARPHLQELAERFQETVNLGVLDANRIAYLEVAESPRAIRFVARRGARDRIHSSALGKAVASKLREEEVRRILRVEGMPACTTATITDVELYLAELGEVRARGYSLDRGENEDGGECVGVVLPGSSTPAAISLAAPAGRLDPMTIKDAVAALRGAARAIAAEVAIDS
jgi:IclR family acetate operon transcriptional repressor